MARGVGEGQVKAPDECPTDKDSGVGTDRAGGGGRGLGRGGQRGKIATGIE